jgi:hypothetical protein
VQPSPLAVARVRRLAAGALALESGTEVDLGALAADDRIAPEDLVSAIDRHRLASLLAPHMGEMGAASRLVDEVEALRTAQRRMLLVQQLELGEVHGMITAAGVPCLVIKGLPLAVQTTGDPGARGPGDLDLLVPPDAVAEVHRFLISAGWHLREGGEVRPDTWAWRHVLRTTYSQTYDGPGSTIDLHWRLDSTLDALPTFEELWERRMPVVLGGMTVPTLAPADAFAHSAFHAAKDRWRSLRSLVDVHRLAALDESWPASRDLHRLVVLSLAVTEASIGLPDRVPPEVRAWIARMPERTVGRALHAQELPAAVGQLTPGLESVLALRYLLRASSSRRDLTRTLASVLLPGKAVVGIGSRSAWTGIPHALWRRLRLAGRRSGGRGARDEAGSREVVRAP